MRGEPIERELLPASPSFRHDDDDDDDQSGDQDDDEEAAGNEKTGCGRAGGRVPFRVTSHQEGRQAGSQLVRSNNKPAETRSPFELGAAQTVGGPSQVDDSI